MYKDIFLEAFSDFMTTNDFIIGLSPAGFQLFQNTQMKHISWNVYLLKSEIQDCRAVALRKKETVSQRCFWNFQNFRTSFPF